MGNNRILIRDNFQVDNVVKRPTVIFDNETKVLYKIGEYVDMLDYYNKFKEDLALSGETKRMAALDILELDKDQELIDKVFNVPGYLGKVLRSWILTSLLQMC